MFVWFYRDICKAEGETGYPCDKLYQNGQFIMDPQQTE